MLESVDWDNYREFREVPQVLVVQRDWNLVIREVQNLQSVQ